MNSGGYIRRREASRYNPPLFTDPEGDSCFSIYQIRWIKKRFFHFFFSNFRETTRHFSLSSQNSEYPRIFGVTGANQNARELLSTDLVNTKYIYFFTRNSWSVTACCCHEKRMEFCEKRCREFWTPWDWIQGNTRWGERRYVQRRLAEHIKQWSYWVTGSKSQVSVLLQKLVVFVQNLKQIVCRRVEGALQCNCDWMRGRLNTSLSFSHPFTGNIHRSSSSDI